MEKPLVSVILPVYGVEPYLNQCVESLVNQTYRNIEIILVDDGSKDRCPQMIDEWAEKDSRIVPIHKLNGGLSSARNVGIEIARGYYIAFIDSDDWVETDYIEKLEKAASMFEADVSVCGFTRKYDYSDIKSKLFIDSSTIYYGCSREQASKYFYETAIAVWGKLYKKEIIGETVFIEGRLAEDFPFQTELLQKVTSVAFCNKHLYNYRIRSNSIAHVIKPKYLIDYINGVSNALHIARTYFPTEIRYLSGYLASLLYEYEAASEFGKEEEEAQIILVEAHNQLESGESLIEFMNNPEDVIFYTFTQFGKYMTKQEKKKVQSDYRKKFSWNLLPKYKLRFFLKYLPSAINLDVTSKILSFKE